MPDVRYERYLGDGLMVSLTDGIIKLSTVDGISTTNVIWLEVMQLDLFLEWLKDMRVEVLSHVHREAGHG